MKEKRLTYILGFIILLLLSLIFFLLLTDKDEKLLQEIIEEEFNFTQRVRQYNLLYSFNLENSLTADCDLSSAKIEWDFPDLQKLDIYYSSKKEIELEIEKELEVETFNTVSEAIKDFRGRNPQLDDLIYDYEVKVISNEKSTYEKMPMYYKDANSNFRILTTTLGIWRNLNGKYKAGLYEPSNSFSKYYISNDLNYFSFNTISEDDAIAAIKENHLKFLNHEFTCEQMPNSDVVIEEIEVIYIHWSDYLIPVYKISGNFQSGREDVSWTALINSIDLKSLDYTIYEGDSADNLFIPRPYISQVNHEGKKYIVEGFLPNQIMYKDEDTKKDIEEISIDFHSKEKSGEYIYGKRKEYLLEEINKSLELEDNGEFKFEFTDDNFWKVEKINYTNELGEEVVPYHSEKEEVLRWEYDNHFQISVCFDLLDSTYCSNKSNSAELNR